MRRLLRHLVLGFAIWLATIGMACIATADSHPPQPLDDSRQVLVLLRLPPEHFRPNADYSGGYGDKQGADARQRIASRLARDHGLTLVTDWPMPLLGVDCFVMQAPAGQSSSEVAALLSRDPGVAWSEPMSVYQGRSAPPTHTDSLYRVQPAARQWRLAELHQIATGRNVRVAVIDSMIEKNHPDLIGQVQISENFVVGRSDAPEQHGTGIAGIIAARADNGSGIAGIAPQARLMALRACWQTPAGQTGSTSTVCDTLSLAKALSFAIDHKAEVINLSLSGPNDPLLAKLIDAALERGITVVSAFDADQPDGGFPASHAGVVAVSDGWPHAPRLGIYVAPGRDVPTTQPGGRWFLVNGSSYAAAHVSGLFALLREKNARARGASALVTVPPGSAIDACATLMRALGPCECGCAHAAGASSVVARQ